MKLITGTFEILFSVFGMIFETLYLTIAGVLGLFTGCFGTVFGGIIFFFLILMLL